MTSLKTVKFLAAVVVLESGVVWEDYHLSFR